MKRKVEMEEGRVTLMGKTYSRWFKLSFTAIIVLLAVSCSNSKESIQISHKETIQKEGLSYLALGDSYTIGESVDENYRWPVLLANELNEQGISTQAPVIIAKTGWRTDELIAALKQHEFDEKYDIISILIGVNNQYQGKDLATYKSDLVTLVELATNYSKRGKAGIFAFSIPDYGVTPFAAKDEKRISEEIAVWNSAYKTVMEKLGIQFYDITPISIEAKDDKSLIAKDELHPSEKMYKVWVNKYANSIISDVLEPQKD
jgi:lysophospholipase L1-like esterase